MLKIFILQEFFLKKYAFRIISALNTPLLMKKM